MQLPFNLGGIPFSARLVYLACAGAGGTNGANIRARYAEKKEKKSYTGSEGMPSIIEGVGDRLSVEILACGDAACGSEAVFEPVLAGKLDLL
eukprot:scaffold184175_cov13-Tisochrysis_lutea.AAC.1